MKTGRPRKSIADYESEAVEVNGCLIHPTFWVARRLYQMRHGKLPSSDIQVCHTCDTPLCILDAHHFVGTQLDNMRDAISKGRHWSQTREHKERMAEMNRSATHKQVVGAASRGRKVTEHTSQLLSEALRGVAKTPQHRAAISTAVKAAWARRKGI